MRRERHPCNLTDYICHGISQLQLLKGHDCNKSCTSICGAGNDFLCYSHVPVLKVHIKPTQGPHAGGLSVKALGNCTKKHSQHPKWMYRIYCSFGPLTVTTGFFHDI